MTFHRGGKVFQARFFPFHLGERERIYYSRSREFNLKIFRRVRFCSPTRQEDDAFGILKATLFAGVDFRGRIISAHKFSPSFWPGESEKRSARISTNFKCIPQFQVMRLRSIQVRRPRTCVSFRRVDLGGKLATEASPTSNVERSLIYYHCSR